MTSPAPKGPVLPRIAVIAGLAAYVGIATALVESESRFRAAGEVLVQRHRAIEAELTGMTSYLDRVEKAGVGQPITLSRLQEKLGEVNDKRLASEDEYETWKTRSKGMTLNRWFVLGLATLLFCPVVLWGIHHWNVWVRDKRLNGTRDD